jgi:hypothetical protein
MGLPHWLNRYQCRANVTVLSKSVGEIENVNYSDPLVGSDELAAQEKQRRWHKLHTYMGRIPDISSKLRPLR